MSSLLLLFAAMLALGIGSTAWVLWRALWTGFLSEDYWGGADNWEDHYGFVFRIVGLFVMLCVGVWMAFQLPELARALGE